MRTAVQIAAGLLLALCAVQIARLAAPVADAAGLTRLAIATRDVGGRGAGQAALRPQAAADGAQPAKHAPAEPPGAARAVALPPDPIASYTILARLDPAKHELHGEGTIVWKNASRVPQRELYIHLYLNGFKDSRSVFLRTPIEGFRGAESLDDHGHIEVQRLVVREMGNVDVWPPGRPTSPGDVDDETDIRVELPRPVEPGETITMDCAWNAHLPSIALRTGHYGSFHMVGQWFPKLALLEADGRWQHFAFHRLSEFFADFGAYDVTIEVPDGFEVGATGRLVEEQRADGKVKRRFVQENVHDFAFAAWDRFRELRVETVDGVAIRCLFPPGAERTAALEIELAQFGLQHFGAAFGSYPYGTLTIVHPPEGAEEAGGMEYPTLITTGGTRAGLAPSGRWIESVTLHELAHQWFYGLIATNEHRYPFLDEGLTTYAEVTALRARYADGSAASAFGLDVDALAICRAGALMASHNGSIAQAAPDFIDGADYGGLVYARAAALLMTLGRVYGEELVGGAIGRYARDNRFRHPGPEALIEAIGAAAGEEAAAALRLGLFDRGWVDYAVAGLELLPHGAAGEQQPTSRGVAYVRRRGTLALPVDVDLHAADGAVSRIRWDGRDISARIPYEGAAPLVAVVIDPERRVLLDEDLTNNARRERRSRVAPRVLDWVSFAAGASLSLIGP